MSFGTVYIGEFDNFSGFLTVCDPVVNSVVGREVDFQCDEETSLQIRTCMPGHYFAHTELNKNGEISALLLHHESLGLDDALLNNQSFEHLATISTAFSHIICVCEDKERDASNKCTFDVEEEALYDARELLSMIPYSKYEKEVKAALTSYLNDCVENGNGNACGENLARIIDNSKIVNWSGFRNRLVTSNHWGIDIKNHVLNSYSPGYMFYGGVATRNTLIETNITALYNSSGMAVCLRIPISETSCGLEPGYVSMYDRNGRSFEQEVVETEQNERLKQQPEVLPIAAGQGAGVLSSFRKKT